MAFLKTQMVGHQKIWERFSSILESKHLAHAYLLVGPSGIGKFLFAKAFAQKAMCKNNGCGNCGDCLKIESEHHESVLIIKPDGLQIKIQQAHEIHQFLNLQSTTPKRFIIIDQAHQMNPQAANSILKVLEEPPENTHFFLISHSEHSVLKTLRSRSQRIQLSPPSVEEIQKKLKVPEWIVKASQGRFDMIQNLNSPDIDRLRITAFSLLSEFHELGLKDTFVKLKEFSSDKENSLYVCLTLQQILRDTLKFKLGNQDLVHSDQLSSIQKISNLSIEKIFLLEESLKRLERDIYGNVDRNLSFENLILDI